MAKGKALLEDIRKELHRDSEGTSPARCTLSAPESGPHRAHGKKPYDYHRSVSLENSRVRYGLKYWMNTDTPEGGGPVAIEGSSGLGMDRPSGVNWYQNNFFEFRYGGKAILKTALADFEVVEAKGDAASIRARWDTPEATVELELVLDRDQRHLTTRCRTTAKGPPKEVAIGFRAYPGRTQKPRDRRAATVKRELKAPQTIELAPPETALVLFDELASRSCCGIDFSKAKNTAAQLILGSYGVTVNLRYKPAETVDSGPVRLWDFHNTTLNRAMHTVFDR